MEDINVLVMDLPHDVNAFCRLNDDGSYTVVINARCSSEEQKRAFMHELRHIERLDHYKTDVQEIEIENEQ